MVYLRGTIHLSTRKEQIFMRIWQAITKRRLHFIIYSCLAIGILVLAYWTLLVPRVDAKTIFAYTSIETYRVDAQGELGNIEIGQPVQFQLDVHPGLVPIAKVYAILPAPVDGKWNLMFSGTAGSNTYVSENYKLLPIGTQYEPNPAGEVRDLRIVVRNSLGITNEFLLPVRVVPVSVSHRTA